MVEMWSIDEFVRINVQGFSISSNSRPHPYYDKNELWLRVELDDGTVFDAMVDNDLLKLQAQVASGVVTMSLRGLSHFRIFAAFEVRKLRQLSVVGVVGAEWNRVHGKG